MVLTCKNSEGVCATCYGRIPDSNEIAGPGEKVGRIAAKILEKSIFEMLQSKPRALDAKSFHIGSPCGNESKTKSIRLGLDRLAEIFNANQPQETEVIAEIDGVVSLYNETDGKRKIVITSDIGASKEYIISREKI